MIPRVKIPNPSVPLMMNGAMNREWWRFFAQLADNADSQSGSVSAAVLNAYYDIGTIGNQGGAIVLLDATSGGTALFSCDLTGGVNSIYNGITGLQLAYNSSVLQLRVTGGVVPRTIRWAMLLSNSQ